jgi:hypothetical protein
VKIAVGVVHGQDIDGWFLNSLVDLLTSKAKDSPYTIDDYVLIRSGPLLAAGRGVLAGQFLENTDADILVMLDDDMVFNPEHIYELVDVLVRSREQDPSVGAVGGLAFISNHPRLATPMPNIWVPHPTRRHEMLHMTEFPADTLMEVGSTGGACVAIHRSVLQMFADAHVNPFHHVPKADWYGLVRKISGMTDEDEAVEVLRQGVWDADQYGEDMSFFLRVREAGYKVLVHTGIVFDHSKSTLLGLGEYHRAVERHKTAQEAPTNG